MQDFTTVSLNHEKIPFYHCDKKGFLYIKIFLFEYNQQYL